MALLEVNRGLVVPASSGDVFVPFPGYQATIVDHQNTEQVDWLLTLEQGTLTCLGDDDPTAGRRAANSSGFIAVRNASNGTTVGGVRYMLPNKNIEGSQSFGFIAENLQEPVSDIVDGFVRQSGYDEFAGCKSASDVIDAAVLSPDMAGKPKEIRQRTEVLLATCRVVGSLLLETGDRTHVMGNLHGNFLGFSRRLGYPFRPIRSDDVEFITEFDGRAHPFLPVFASLEDYHQRMLRGETRHLQLVNESYQQIGKKEREKIATSVIQNSRATL